MSKYETAFLSDEYEENNPEHRDFIRQLRDLIADQIPILELLIDIHRAKVPSALRDFHQHLEECFIKRKSYVESKYGKKSTDLRDDHDRDSIVVLRRSHFCVTGIGENNRLSETSMGSSE